MREQLRPERSGAGEGRALSAWGFAVLFSAALRAPRQSALRLAGLSQTQQAPELNRSVAKNPQNVPTFGLVKGDLTAYTQ